jgi:hypothetical protein
MQPTTFARNLTVATLAMICLVASVREARAELAAGDGATYAAATLKKDQATIGLLLHPTAVGMHDRVQLGTVVMMSLIGIPNLSLSVKLIDGERTDVTVIGECLYGMDWGIAVMMFKNTAIARGKLVAAHQFGDLTLGLRAGGGRQMIHGDNESDYGFFTITTVEATLLDAGAYAELRLDDRNLLFTQADFVVPFLDEELAGEAGTINGLHADDVRWDMRLGWTHVWGRVRTGLMLVHARNMVSDDAIPVRPFADLWYTF